MQVSRLDVAAKSLKRCAARRRLLDLDRATDLHLVDANAGAIDGRNGAGDVFKLDGLVADVETETDVLAEEAFLFSSPLP